MRISPETIGETEAEKHANGYLAAWRSHQYTTVDGYLMFCPEELQDEIELLIGQRMRHVMACQRMANAFRQSELPMDQALVRVLDEPLKMFVTDDEFEAVIAKLPRDAIADKVGSTVIRLINGSIIEIEGKSNKTGY